MLSVVTSVFLSVSSVRTVSVSPVLSSEISTTSSRTSPVSSGTIASGTVVALLTVFVAGDVLLFFFLVALVYN